MRRSMSRLPDRLIDASADRLAPRPPEGPFRHHVPFRDPAVLVHADVGIQGGVEDASRYGLALAQGLGETLRLGETPPPLHLPQPDLLPLLQMRDVRADDDRPAVTGPSLAGEHPAPVSQLHLVVFRGVQMAPQPLAQPLLVPRSEEHTSELQSLMRISYAVFCL